MAAGIEDKFMLAAPNWVGAIGSGGVADASVETIPLVSTTNLPTTTAIEITVDRVDANGTETPSKMEVIKGIVSSNNLISCERGKEGTAQAHSAGAIVEVMLTADIWNGQVDGLLVEHNQDGTHSNILDEDDMASDSATQPPSQQSVKAYVLAVASQLNPIGTIREFNVATNPATLLGFGTWSLYGVGRSTICIDSSDTDFDTVDETIGEKTHTLSAAESGLPAHTHAGSNVSVKHDNAADGNFVHGGSDASGTAGTWTVPTTQANTAANASSAHNNIQPSIVVYRWVRTA